MAYRGSDTFRVCAALVLLSAPLAAQERPNDASGELEAQPDATPSSQPEPSAEAEATREGHEGEPAAHTADEVEPPDPSEPTGGLDEICKIDPKACPTLDMRREAAKPLGEPKYATVRSLREKTDSRIVLPAGLFEFGGEVAFVTGDSPRTDEKLASTDLALLRLAARRSFFDFLEVDLGSSFAIKQPTESDEPLYQGATLGTRVEFAEGWAAELAGAHAPLLQNEGSAWTLEQGFTMKHKVHHYLRFRLGAGGSLTTLDYENPGAQPFWLEEAFGRGEVQIGERSGSFWVGLDYRVPVQASPDRESPDPNHGHLQPETSLGLEIGGVVGAPREGWDVYAVYRVVDRGDAERPETELPLLDGGFDQTQFIFGVVHQFGLPPVLR